MISIIVPVYNAERTIKRCAESLLKQKLNNKEFIFVNDGSKDSSLNILKKLKEENSNIVIIDKLNGGVSSARNAGLKVARGEFVTFIDADDYYLDNQYISNMLKRIMETNADMVVSGLTLLKSDGKHEIHVENNLESTAEFINNFFAYSNQGIFNSPWNKVFRKEKIVEMFCEDMTFGEDAVFVSNYLLNCQKIALCSECGYGYEVLDTSTTAEYRQNIRYDMKQTNRYYIALANVWFKYLDYNNALENYMKLKTQGVYTILLRIFSKDGIIQFFRQDISEILSDSILNEHRSAILNRKSKKVYLKMSKYILCKKKTKIKFLVIIQLICNRIRWKRSKIKFKNMNMR